MERMRPMDSAPRDGTEVLLWFTGHNGAAVCFWNEKYRLWDEREDDPDGWREDQCAGWTPIVRPLEPEPAPILPPTPQRLRLQIRSAAQESVALGQSLAAFQALAGVAHARATKRAEGAR